MLLNINDLIIYLCSVIWLFLEFVQYPIIIDMIYRWVSEILINCSKFFKRTFLSWTIYSIKKNLNGNTICLIIISIFYIFVSSLVILILAILTLSCAELFCLGATTNTSIESAERNTFLMFNHVFQVFLSSPERHALDSTSSLMGVLKFYEIVQLISNNTNDIYSRRRVELKKNLHM